MLLPSLQHGICTLRVDCLADRDQARFSRDYFLIDILPSDSHCSIFRGAARNLTTPSGQEEQELQSTIWIEYPNVSQSKVVKEMMPLSFETISALEIIFRRDFEEEDYKLRHRRPSQMMSQAEPANGQETKLWSREHCQPC